MKGLQLLILFIFLISIHIINTHAQVFRGELTISKQIQIDTFYYSEIIGDLRIKETSPGEITNLKGLKTLREITSTRISSSGFVHGGDLVIDSIIHLKNLEGLENLLTIGRSLRLTYNISLENIDALANLKRLRWDLIIGNNPLLENIDALKNIRGLNGLAIVNNEKLKNIDGLSGISSIWSGADSYGSSYISNNSSLSNIDGLSNMIISNYGFEISNNPVLQNIDGLHRLERADFLTISNNASLINLNGLAGLKYLQELTIFGNVKLSSLSGVSNLVGVGVFWVYENPALTQFCELYNILKRDTAFLTDSYRYNVYSNGANPTVQEILDNGPCSEDLYVTILNYKNGGEIREGSQISLTWDSNVSNLNLQYRDRDSSEWHFITNALTSQGHYIWTVPQVNSNKEIFLRYFYPGNTQIYDTSIAPLFVMNVLMNLTEPSGGENFEAGQNVNINWTSTNAEKFKLEYSINGGGSWNSIAENLTTNSYLWKTPQIISNHMKVRLSEQDIPGIFAESGEFIITEDCDYISAKMSHSKFEGITINPSFSINSYVSTRQLSFTAWVKFDSLKSKMPVIDRYNETVDGSRFWIKFVNKELVFGYSQGAVDNQQLTEASAIVNITTGKWYHVAAVRDGRLNQLYVKLYFDGNLIDSTYAIFRGIAGSTEPIIIGNSKDIFYRNNNSFPGSISEVQMMNVTLSHEQIKDRMFKQPDVVRDSVFLVGYWKLNGNADDYSVYKNHGLINGKSAWICDHPFLPYEQPSDSWQIQITGKTTSLKDAENYAGVSRHSSDQYDQSDIPEPPAQPGNYIRVYFPHPEWNNKLARDYSQDIRSISFQNSPKSWLFEVQSNIHDTIKLTFNKYELPQTMKAYFSDLSKPERNLPLPAEYVYYNSSSEPKPFLLVLSEDDMPQYNAPFIEVIEPNGGEIWKSNAEGRIKWNADQSKAKLINIYSIKNDGVPVLISAMDASKNEFVWNTPNEYWNNNYKIKVVVTDTSGYSGEDLSNGTFTIVGDSVAKKSKAGFSLISIPLNTGDSSRSSIFEDDIQNSTYFIYKYLDNNYTITDYIVFGLGYWLALDKERTWDVKGKVLMDDSTVIDLRSGYNLIGNRYVRELKKNRDLSILYKGISYNFWNAVRNEIITPSLLGTSGKYYYSSDILAPFEGYWIGVLKEGVKLIQHLPLLEKKGTELPDSTMNVFNWHMNISVNSSEVSDEQNYFGVHKNASSDFDAMYDIPEPPLSPREVPIRLYFVIKENKYENLFGEKFSGAFRAPDDVFFEFKVENEKAEEVTISWDNSRIKNIEGIQLKLVDKQNDVTIDMLEQKYYSFQYTSISEFIIIGSNVTGVGSSNIPDRYYITQNYPNPFNPTTRFEYGLPDKVFVTIKIYDIAGREVQTILQEEKPAGKHYVEWKAENLATGLYFCRITAGEFISVRKMILLK